MREGWRVAKLGDLASDEKGAIAIGPFGSRMKTSDYSEAGLSVIRGQDITPTGRISGASVFVSEQFARGLGNARLKRGDLVFPHRGAIGLVGIVPTDRYVMSTSLMRIRLNAAVASPEFVCQFLASAQGRSEILRFGSTVGTPGIGQPLTSLRQFRIPLPPLEEQRSIAAVLGALDDLIETNEKLAADAWDMCGAVFDRVTSGQRETSLGSCITLNYGKALPARSRRTGGVAVVSSAGVVGCHDVALVRGPGVVVGRKGTVGSVTWVPGDFFPIDTTFYVESDLPPLYAYFLLARSGLSGLNTDSAVPGLNRSNALARNVQIADSDGQQTFWRQTGPLLEAFQSLGHESDALRRTRDELLPLLMSGAVSPGEVEVAS